jgi:hypothetical protein
MPYKDESVRKSKHKEYSREHYLRNKDRLIIANTKYKQKKWQEWKDYKSALSCKKCGFSHIAALDFHHEDPTTKEYDVNRLISNGQFKKAGEEIKKCIVLCANCHRVWHFMEREGSTFSDFLLE